MPKTVISVENLTKRYDLGVIGTGTLSRDLNRWWARLRHQPDPYTKIGQENKYRRRGESILALNDISFTVEQGEALGIIGKNGAGKSTLLKILSRVTAPTSGVVKVRGRIGSLLEVGTGFHPELTGRENVFLNGAILGMRKDEVDKKFDEIVGFSGVEKFIDTPVKRYSSGMYVRLAFAVAAHLDPEILVVDEVLAVGDAEFQKKCLGKMGDVAGEGRTVLFVSHNMAAIQNLCSKSILLESGNLSFQGPTESTINKYVSYFRLDENKPVNDSLSNTFKLINFYVSQNNNKCNEFALTNKPLHIHLEYDVIDPSQNLLIGFEVFTSQGLLICRSYDNEIFTKDKRKAGVNHTVFEFPANTFQPNDYFISLIFCIHRKTKLDRKKIMIPIKMEETQISDIDLPGVIKPNGKWRKVN